MKNAYEMVVKMFEQVKNKHPKSNVAFDTSTGKILLHRAGHEEFASMLQNKLEKRPGLIPGIVIRERKGGPNKFIFAKT